MAEVELKSVVGTHPARIGAGLALASLPGHLLLPATASHQLAAVVLVLVAGIYVGFALQDGRARTLAVEASVALGFTGAALTGLWVSAWTIPAAYALHGLWDLAHHRYVATAMPGWYAPFCAVFDWVFAVGIVAIWIAR